MLKQVTILVAVGALLFPLPALAFSFTIQGKVAKGLKGDVSLQTYLGASLQTVHPDSNGIFRFSAELAHPSQFTIYYFDLKSSYRYTFYLFNTGTIQASLDPARKGNEWNLEGLCARCKAFEKADLLAWKTHQKLNIENEPQILKQFATDVKKIIGIGVDEYTQMHIDMHTLSMQAGIVDPATHNFAHHVYQSSLFRKYVPANDKYAGFRLYITMMGTYVMNQALDSVISQRIHGSIPTFNPMLPEAYALLKMRQVRLPASVYADAIYQLIDDNRDPSFADSVSQQQMKIIIRDFLKLYPAHPESLRVKQIESYYKQPLLKSMAPEEMLIDRREAEFMVSKFKSRYVVMNLWHPRGAYADTACAIINQLSETFKAQKRVYLMNVCLMADRKQWLKMMKTDTLKGNHYWATDPDMPDRYQLFEVPTSIILNPAGKVIYKGHTLSISKPFLEKVLAGKLD